MGRPCGGPNEIELTAAHGLLNGSRQVIGVENDSAQKRKTQVGPLSCRLVQTGADRCRLVQRSTIAPCYLPHVPMYNRVR